MKMIYAYAQHTLNVAFLQRKGVHAAVLKERLYQYQTIRSNYQIKQINDEDAENDYDERLQCKLSS